MSQPDRPDAGHRTGLKVMGLGDASGPEARALLPSPTTPGLSETFGGSAHPRQDRCPRGSWSRVQQPPED